jgi:hypothetical protein
MGSVKIGGNATGSAIVVGDHNAVEVHYSGQLPPPESVDIAKELAALRTALAALGGEHQKRIERALDDADDEAKKPNPDKDEIGKALDRALDYAKKTSGFVETMAKIAPTVAAAASWLGANWHTLLRGFGLG